MKKISLDLKFSINYTFSLAFLALYIVTFVIDLMFFHNISMVSSLMCIGSTIVFTIFLSRLRPLYYIGIMIFSCFAQYFGAMLNLYKIIPIYDKLLHLASGILLVFLGHYAYEILLMSRNDHFVPNRVIVSLCFLFSIASAAVWEIWEYSGDKLLGLTSQGVGIDDTMQDIIAGTIGAIIGTFILYRLLKNNMLKQVKKSERKKAIHSKEKETVQSI